MKKSDIAILFLGLLSELGYLSLYFIPNYHNSFFPFLGWITLEFVLYFMAVGLLLKKGFSENLFVPILTLSLLFHLTLLPSQPIFEDDIYRYVWDGKMLVNGINPYRFSPDAPELLSLRDASIWPNINFKYIATIYPPVAEILFALAYRAGPDSLLAMKGMILVFNFLLIILLSILLKALGLNRNRVLLYAWNPLVMKEVGNSGHMDPLAACLLLGSFLMLARKRNFIATLLYALSILSKFYPLLLLPSYYKRVGRKGMLALFILAGAFYFPFYMGLGFHQLFHGLTAYGRYWMFNPGLFDLTRALLSFFTKNPEIAAKAVHGLLLAVSVLYLYRKDDASLSGLLSVSFYLFGILVLLSPVVNTWYLICLLPFLSFFPSPPWLLFTYLVFAGYTFFLHRTDIPWIRGAEYGIFYGVLIFYSFKNRRSLL